MIQNAEKKSGPRLAGKEDDRILRVGKVLRRTRLDELPQIYNILKGDMSFCRSKTRTAGTCTKN